MMGTKYVTNEVVYDYEDRCVIHEMSINRVLSIQH